MKICELSDTQGARKYRDADHKCGTILELLLHYGPDRILFSVSTTHACIRFLIYVPFGPSYERLGADYGESQRLHEIEAR